VTAADIRAALAADAITLYPVVDAGGALRTFNGDLGGRAGADGLCVASQNRPVRANLQYRALISTAADDEIADFVTK
jgi:hypothetical protein